MPNEDKKSESEIEFSFKPRQFKPPLPPKQNNNRNSMTQSPSTTSCDTVIYILFYLYTLMKITTTFLICRNHQVQEHLCHPRQVAYLKKEGLGVLLIHLELQLRESFLQQKNLQAINLL